jgi:septum formation protein
MTGLVLASASPTRAGLLRAAGVPFEIVPARVDEGAVKDSLLAEGAQPRAVADALAELKAVRISSGRPEDVILGADQVLEIDGDLVSKSEDVDEARSLLRRLRGHSHRLITAAVLARGGGAIWRHVSTVILTMRPFSDDFLETYLAEGGEDILGGVGCYRMEGRGLQLFSRIDGDYFSILGLPMLALLTALREQGIIAR